jgi:transcription-repair coupling factor (superfamily II helicase)
LKAEDIINHYRNQDKTRMLVAHIKNHQKEKIHLKGMVGSSPAMLTAALQLETPHTSLFILPGREEAAYFLNDIENVLGEKSVLFFPSSYKKPYQVNEPENANVLQRAEVLSRISKSKSNLIVVSYAEAIHEKVVTRHQLARNTIEAKVGEELSIDFIVDFLTENGFSRVDFVSEAGEFAVRGGIVDIYSFANDLPYRVEFAGNRIDSIRVFDTGSQLSEKFMHVITIIPNVQNKLLEEERTSFLDFIGSDVIIFANGLEASMTGIELNYEALGTSNLVALDENGDELKMAPQDMFDTPYLFSDLLNAFTIAEWGNKSFFKPGLVLEYNQQPQPSFNKNFDLLTRDFIQNNSKGYTNIIFSDTARQVERIYAIFDDLASKARQTSHPFTFFPVLLSLHEGFIDHDLKLACYTDHQVFDRYHRFRLKKNYSKSQALTIRELNKLKPGDYITHIDHGIGRFAGLEKIDVNGTPQEAIRLIYKDNDVLYISIHSLHRITRYVSSEGTEPVMHKLGGTAWATLKTKTKKKVKDIAKDLIALYAKRKAQKGFAFSPDTYLQNELEASFIYEDTPDQIKSTKDVKTDMEKEYPMDRLICGDVGFGKTEIAIRAAFKAVADGKQVAVLVPTTILALQHYKTFSERLKDLPCTVDYINRFKSAAQQSKTLKSTAEGKTDILIGTHRLLSKDIKFKDLGLLIVDEEQKFGVAAKEKIKSLRVNVDTLTLTATPIPRTLQFSLMGARDLSIITTPPPNRYPITTELHVFNENIIRDAIIYEVSRGGQVFFVHNRVQNIHEMADLVKRLCPDVRVVIGHGQMEGEKLESVLMEFIEGEADVLVATTIIESGLDISNANTIIINQAQNFGLSDLHQMRGRVGRSNKKAFCYLLAPPFTVLTQEARQRLKAIEEFSDLGSGFNISMRDLDIRGAGNLLGGEQSGFIAEIGFEMYHKILDEAIRELKDSDFRELFPKSEHESYVYDCQIDTDLEILIPTSYVENITERMSLYKEIDDIEKEEDLKAFEASLSDRFGPIPHQVFELFNTIRLRWKSKDLGFEKIVLKNNLLKAYFVSNPQSAFFKSEVFSAMLRFVQKHPHTCRMKEEKGKLSISFSGIRKVEEANKLLQDITSTVLPVASN